MKLPFYAVIVLLLLLTQTGRAQVADSDELAIYRDLLSNTRTVVMEKPAPEAKPSPDYRYSASELADMHAMFKGRFPQVDDATISYFLSHESHLALLTPQSNIGVKLVFLEQTTFDAISSSGTDSMWTPFRTRFPGATIVNKCDFCFNATRTKALVGIFWNRDGDLREFLAEKRDGKWVLESSSVVSGAW